MAGDIDVEQLKQLLIGNAPAPDPAVPSEAQLQARLGAKHLDIPPAAMGPLAPPVGALYMAVDGNSSGQWGYHVVGNTVSVVEGEQLQSITNQLNPGGLISTGTITTGPLTTPYAATTDKLFIDSPSLGYCDKCNNWYSGIHDCTGAQIQVQQPDAMKAAVDEILERLRRIEDALFLPNSGESHRKEWNQLDLFLDRDKPD